MSVGMRNQVKQVSISVAASGYNAIVGNTVGKSVVVVALLLVNGAATGQNVTLVDSGSLVFTGAMPLNTAGVPLFLDAKPDIDYFTTVSGRGFGLSLSAATQVSGSVWYVLF